MKFSELDLHPLLQKNIDKINYVECTPIQADAIPHVLQGRDIAGLAQTGTGKTAAFLIPLIDRVLRGREQPMPETPVASETANAPVAVVEEPAAMDVEKIAPGEVLEAVEAAAPVEAKPMRYFADWRRRQFILVLVPTRELAEQVFENATKLLENTGMKCVSVYGGTTYDKQKAGFKEGVEFVIATPGRLLDLFKENIVDLRQVRAVVFDEADRMFDMGFKDDMKFILRRLPRDRQFLVFSATLNFEVLNVAYEYGAQPIEINVSKDQPKAENVTDELLHVGHEDKPKFLLSLLKKHNPRQGIIFSNFKHNVERLARFLTDNGVPAVGISSLLTQAQRNRVMAQFKGDNDQNMLVATDLAARGLDILGVDMVINFELPDDHENYVHRIGRTGRAGHKGSAISLVSDRDVDALARIEDYLGHKVPIAWIDDGELIKDMKPFPFEPRRSSGGGSGPRREGGRHEGGRHEGGRHEGGRDSRPRGGGAGRGPRREGGGPRHEGDRPREGQQARGPGGGGRGPRRDRPHGDRPRQEGAPRPEGAAPSGQPSRNRNDRSRHEGRPPQNGDRPRHEGGPRRPNRGGARPEGPRENRNDNGQRAARPSRPQHQSGGYRRPGAGTGAPAKVANPVSLGQKVSGFFKKLIGKSKT